MRVYHLRLERNGRDFDYFWVIGQFVLRYEPASKMLGYSKTPDFLESFTELTHNLQEELLEYAKEGRFRVIEIKDDFIEDLVVSIESKRDLRIIHNLDTLLTLVNVSNN